MKHQTLTQSLKIGGLALIGLEIAFLLFMGIGEMAGGDFSGISHLFPSLVLGGLAALSLRSSRVGGAALAAVGLLIGVFFYIQMSSLSTRLTAFGLTGAPILLGGLLLLAASGLAEKPEHA